MTQSETRPTPDQVTEFVRSLYDVRDQEFDIKNLSLDELRALKEQEDEGYSEFIDCLAEGMCSMLDEYQVKVMIQRIDWSRSTDTDLKQSSTVKGLRHVLLKSVRRFYPDLEVK